MTMMSSPFGLDDMEALLWGPSCPMADPTEQLLHRDEVTSTVGGPSPLSSSSSSPLPLTSPPPSPPALLLQEEKAEADLRSLTWLAADDLGHTRHVGKEDAFCGLDWMSERVDLSEFDLDSLMGSCSPDGPPTSPEDLLTPFECPMELDSLPLSTPVDLLPLLPGSPARDDPSDEIHSPPPCVPDPQEELEIKSEPRSPSPPPTFTLDLGSEVDLSEGGSSPLAVEVPQSVPRIVVSLSPTRIILLLAPKQEVVATTTTDTSFREILSSDAGCSSQTFSSASSKPSQPSISTPQSRSHTRSKPYPAVPRPQHSDSPPRAASSGKMRPSAGGIPKERKLKKMEQNKTAATRYRHKKKTEQEALTAECDDLEKRNRELGERAESLAREIQYLRDLMEEVRQARSRKSP